ncbi:hypothetical protein TRICI_002036 [Trichomonascus ciferrii]|uniref:Glycoside hydrolase family 105 protein n=1 Tax=Trichomonascus ciferrii TaxID=44093 RepID=A0A642V963_9ASCO|nr:hypothetical protein TRICI_002036 [Trichomonascus ciferrii]
MPATIADISPKQVHSAISLLTDGLVSIRDVDQERVFVIDGVTIDTKAWNSWEWTHGIGLYGQWYYYAQTGSTKALEVMKDWFENRLFKEQIMPKNVNTMAPFLTLAYLYEHFKDQRYLVFLDTWAEWAMYEAKRTRHGGIQHVTYLEDNHNQLWDDTLMMTVLPLTKIGKLLNRPHYIEEAKRQFLIHIRYLADIKTGLFYHGFCFDGNHHFANALWARGNSWLTIAIPEFLELLDLPDEDGFKQYLLEVYESQVEALAKLQDPESGLWHTLLDDPSSYLESSATAGFAFGILKGIRRRYISKEKYLDVGLKAIKGVLNNVDSNGELLNTSFGTGMGRDLQFYKDIPITSMPYGQAMAIMALSEFARFFV